jgi:hypothetical protein
MRNSEERRKEIAKWNEKMSDSSDEEGGEGGSKGGKDGKANEKGKGFSKVMVAGGDGAKEGGNADAAAAPNGPMSTNMQMILSQILHMKKKQEEKKLAEEKKAQEGAGGE